MNKDNTNHDPLLIIRALGCLIVIWTHIYPNFLIQFGNINLTFLAHPNSSDAVFTFYLLSGYGIGYGFASHRYLSSPLSLAHYYVNRLLRMVPVYYICVLVGVFVLYRSYNINSSAIIRFLTFTSTDTTMLPVLRSLFIVAQEMQFYIIAPMLSLFMVHFFHKLPFVFSSVIIFSIGTVIRYILYPLTGSPELYTRNVFTTVLGNIDTFLFGMLLSYAVVAHKQHSKINPFYLPIATFTLFILWFIQTSKLQYMIGVGDWFSSWRNQMMFMLPPSTSITMGLMIWVLMTKAQVRTRSTYPPLKILQMLQNPKTFLTAVGVLSYGVFLWQATIVDVFINPWTVQVGFLPTLGSFALIAGLSILLSAATYSLVEWPLSKFKFRH